MALGKTIEPKIKAKLNKAMYIWTPSQKFCSWLNMGWIRDTAKILVVSLNGIGHTFLLLWINNKCMYYYRIQMLLEECFPLMDQHWVAWRRKSAFASCSEVHALQFLRAMLHPVKILGTEYVFHWLKCESKWSNLNNVLQTYWLDACGVNGIVILIAVLITV